MRNYMRSGAMLVAIFAFFVPAAHAGEWRRGDVAGVRQVCLNEPAILKFADAWETDALGMRLLGRALARSGDCGVFRQRMPSKLVRRVRAFTAFQGDAMEVWELNMLGVTVFALLPADAGPEPI